MLAQILGTEADLAGPQSLADALAPGHVGFDDARLPPVEGCFLCVISNNCTPHWGLDVPAQGLLAVAVHVK